MLALDSGRDPLDVRWIYVASKDGPISVFPGTDVIAAGYVTKSRPWYQAIFPPDGQPTPISSLSSDVPDQTDRLSVTYLDIFTESSILVRTYLTRTFTKGLKTFVVGIDLKRRREVLGGGAGPGPAESIWTSLPLLVRVVAAISLSLLGSWFFRWMSCTKRRSFRFERSEPCSYGMIDVKEKVGVHDKVQDNAWVGHRC